MVVKGHLLATGRGEVDIEEEIILTRGVHCHPKEHITVEFGPVEEGCSPCSPCSTDSPDCDELEWDVVGSYGPGDRSHTILVLRIRWKVACPRKIKWTIKER